MWPAVDHEGEVLEAYVTKKRNKAAALKFLKKVMKRYGSPQTIVTDRLKSYGAAMKDIGNKHRQEVGQWINNRCKIHTYPSDDENGQCSGSDECEVYRNSHQRMPHCTTISTENDT
jgi:transposase-like protein